MVKTFFYEHYVTMCLFDMLLRLNVRDKLFPRRRRQQRLWSYLELTDMNRALEIIRRHGMNKQISAPSKSLWDSLQQLHYVWLIKRFD